MKLFRTSAVVSVLSAALGVSFTPVAVGAAGVPTIDPVVQVGQVMDYSFPCDWATPDRWFRDGVPIDGQVINTYTVRAQDLGTRLSVERRCAGTGETMRTPESGVVTGSGPRVPVIGNLAHPPDGQAFLNVPDAQSSVVGDPTDPGVDLYVGQLAADDRTLVDPSTLTVTVTAVQKGQRVAPLDATGVRVTSTGSVRHVSFTPTQRGNVTLVFTVSGTTGVTASYSLDYYASAATTPTSRVLQATSDASTAIAAGDGYLFVADDEIHEIRLYNGKVSGPPVAVFSPGTSTGEDDYESSARSGDSVFWLGAHGNSKAGEVQPGRQVVYETTIRGSGANATLTPVGKYSGLRKDLIAWDQAHGNRYGFAAAAAAGQGPDGPAQFNIEASEFAPDGNTLYLGFRGPLTGRVAGGKALIVPVTNIKQLTRGQATKATFGPSIEYDLGGHSVREIRKNAAGEYLLLTADAVPRSSPSGVKHDQLLWYWDGQPQTVPEKLTTVVPRDVEECYGTTGAWEGIGEMPAQLTSGSQVRLIMDQGYVCPYSPSSVGMTAEEHQAKWESTQQKDIAADQLRKSRTDVVTLTGAMGVGASLSGSGAFGEERAGASSAAHSVTVTNTGTKPLTISQVSLADDDGFSARDFRVDSGTCPGKTLAVGATCEAQVRFVPARTGVASTARLQVSASGGHAVGSLTLTGSSAALFVNASTPTISNLSPTVGDTLTASTPAWTPAAALSHQWLRDGQPIGGPAAAASYAVTGDDVGHRISVTVTGTAAGHVPESRTSAPTGVVAARATPAPAVQQVIKNVDAAISVRTLTKRRVQVRVRAKGVPAALLTQALRMKIAGVAKAYRVKLVRGQTTIRLAGAKAAGVKTGQRVRVSVRVRPLTTTLTTPDVVTTYQVGPSTHRATVTVRR